MSGAPRMPATAITTFAPGMRRAGSAATIEASCTHPGQPILRTGRQRMLVGRPGVRDRPRLPAEVGREPTTALALVDIAQRREAGRIEDALAGLGDDDRSADPRFELEPVAVGPGRPAKLRFAVRGAAAHRVAGDRGCRRACRIDGKRQALVGHRHVRRRCRCRGDDSRRRFDAHSERRRQCGRPHGDPGRPRHRGRRPMRRRRRGCLERIRRRRARKRRGHDGSHRHGRPTRRAGGPRPLEIAEQRPMQAERRDAERDEDAQAPCSRNVPRRGGRTPGNRQCACPTHRPS